jgi:hypothetical protein
MPQDSVERLLGRLITDDNFRKTANQKFSQTCYEYGFDLTEQEQSLIQKIDFNAFNRLAEILDNGIRRGGE